MNLARKSRNETKMERIDSFIATDCTLFQQSNVIKTQPISWTRNFLNFRRSYNRSQLNRAWKWKLIIRTSALDTLLFLNRIALSKINIRTMP